MKLPTCELVLEMGKKALKGSGFVKCPRADLLCLSTVYLDVPYVRVHGSDDT